MVYMNGSDLEGDYGAAATADLRGNDGCPEGRRDREENFPPLFMRGG